MTPVALGYQGELVTTRELRQGVVLEWREEGRPVTETGLTARQREIAALIAEGLTNAEIADRLVLTTGTVGNHIGHIMRALGVKNRVQVAVWAVERGLRASPHARQAPSPDAWQR
jgi:DNA-binding NarL/FixJ family response regulator